MSKSQFQSDAFNSIWWITFSPIVWACHLLASYLTAAIFCAKHAESDGSAGEVQIAIMIYTAVALSVIVLVGRAGYRQHRSEASSAPHDAPTQADQRRLLGWTTFLLSLLSGVATIFTTMAAFFIGSCH